MGSLFLPSSQPFLQKELAVGEIARQGEAAVDGDELAGHIGDLGESVGSEGDIFGSTDAADGLGTAFGHQPVGVGDGEFAAGLATDERPLHAFRRCDAADRRQ